MRRSLAILIATMALLLALVGPASAGGVNPAQLQRAGWACLNVPGLGVHCFPPAQGGKAQPVLYWFDTTDPDATEADFSGTELLLFPGAYHGQPCPQQGQDEWTWIGFAYACHHQ